MKFINPLKQLLSIDRSALSSFEDEVAPIYQLDYRIDLYQVNGKSNIPFERSKSVPTAHIGFQLTSKQMSEAMEALRAASDRFYLQDTLLPLDHSQITEFHCDGDFNRSGLTIHLIVNGDISVDCRHAGKILKGVLDPRFVLPIAPRPKSPQAVLG